ncbi:hypothetical protein BKA67DRAFT_562655 [Truncatella angustata]|uniref:Clr5 domain-containing protein n=1 Tax=Truncatella angustata TaxID=152316 RepID=A0A9P8ZYJ3_9PEZI|nr:uncharacterized protein BKA67DRAFT_562655 [Truncatella angustata]KAH6656106.1 hypothetical protein BKA67DRAFT_562655 [Truncatella angustata]KAH8202383.1 hypothetical protein TruAng_003456 [Truncatella angustata]
MSADTRHAVTAHGRSQRCDAAKTGPSAEEWDLHKATIINLYKTMKWQDMDEIMRNKYRFHASKRMYNQRFRQWSISKYLKTSDKDVLMQKCGNSVKELGERLKAGHINKQEYDRTLRWFKSIQPVYPTRPISSNEKVIRTERILQSLRHYYHKLAEDETKGGRNDCFFNLDSSKESSDLWFGILRGIKSLDSANDPTKIARASSRESAAAIQAQAIATNEAVFSMLRHVGVLAAAAMLKQPLDFLCELLIETSAIKSKEWSKIRGIILRFFNQEATRVFCFEHPIAVLCRELQKDGHYMDVATRSIVCIRDVCDELWGKRSILAFKSQKALYTATLKSLDLKKAAKIGKDLLVSSEEIWGTESQQARISRFRLGQLHVIENEFSHAAGKSDRAVVENALQYLHDVIRLPPSGVTSGPRSGLLEDETTLGAMADIAFLHNRCGNDAEALAWYQKTAEMSRRICEPGSNVTKAAIEEVIAKLKEMSKLDQAVAWEEILKHCESAAQNRST